MVINRPRIANLVLLTLTLGVALRASSQPGNAPYYGASALQLKSRNPVTVELVDISRPLKRPVAAGDVLEASFGIPPDVWRDAANDGVFSIEIKVRRGWRSKVIFSRDLNPANIQNDRGWQKVSAPLDGFAGSTVTIAMSARVSGPRVKPHKVDGVLWGGLRLGNFQRKPGEMNVILISLDTLRSDHLSLYGYDRKTSPHIDRIAQGGVWFAESVAQSPNTKPSTMSMLTGLHPSEHNVWRPSNGTQLATSVPTLADILSKSGYLTQAYTGSVLTAARYGFSRGFDRYEEFGRPQRGDGWWVFGSGEKFIRAHAKDKFFLFLHTYEIHTPYRHRRYVGSGDGASRLDNLYDGGVSFVDERVADIWRTINDAGIANDTLLIIVSDHGEQLNDRSYFREHGHTLYEEIIRVPMIFRLGDRLPPREVSGFQAQHIDLLPTILEMTGAGALPGLPGMSLSGILKGKRPPAESAVISEGVQHGGRDLASIRYTADGVARKFVYSPSAAAGTSSPGNFSKTQKNLYWLAKVIPSHGREFYDLNADPKEEKDLAEGSPKEMATLAAILQNYLARARVSGWANMNFNSKESDEPGLDPEARQQLRSLGY